MGRPEIASIKLPLEWGMRSRSALPLLLPKANGQNGVKPIAVTCIRCGRTTWSDEIALCSCRRGQ